jgi:dipeptidyl-peptidase-4
MCCEIFVIIIKGDFMKALKVLLCFFLLSGLAGGQMYTIDDIYSKPSLSGQYKKYKWLKEKDNLVYMDNNVIYLLDVLKGSYSPLIKSDFFGKDINIKNYSFNDSFTKLLVDTDKGYFLVDRNKNTFEEIKENNISYVSVSPSGRYLTYIKDYNLYIRDLDTGSVIQVTNDGSQEVLNGLIDWVYGEEIYGRADPDGYKWSPDEKYLAFYRMIEKDVKQIPIFEGKPPFEQVSYQYYPTAGTENPLVLVMIYDVDTKSLLTAASSKTLNDENGYLPYYLWGPDSNKLYYIYMNRNQTEAHLENFDLKSKNVKEVLTEDDPYWLNIQNTKDMFYPLKDNDHFIWASERDGFCHLYLGNIQDKTLIQITRGNFQVESLDFVDETNKVVYFTSTEKSPLMRHFYKISYATYQNNFQRISQGDGTHSVKMSNSGEFYMDSFSNIEKPTKVLLYDKNGKAILTLDENEAPILKYKLKKPEFFTLEDKDGNIFHCQLIKPINFDETKKYPVIVYIYGGPGSQSVRDMWGGNRYLFNQYLANKGYLIFSLDNRGSYGRGKKWENMLYKKFGEYELQDQIEGLNYLFTKPYVDTNRIGIWGWSYGGYMTTIASAKRSDIFKVGVAGAPVIDWKNYDTIYTERYLKKPQDNENGYLESSIINYVDGLTGKYLVIHGTSDDNVHIDNSVQLIYEMVQRNKLIDVMVYPGEKHGFGDISSLHLYNLIADYFISNL